MEHSLDVDVAESLIKVDREEEFALGLGSLGCANNDVLEAFLEEAPACVLSLALYWSAYDQIVLIERLQV